MDKQKEKESLDQIKEKFYQAVQAKKNALQKMLLWLSYYLDEHFTYIDRRNAVFIAPTEDQLKEEARRRRIYPMTINKCKPAVKTVVSYMTKKAPRIYVRTSSNQTVQKRGSASAANTLMSYENNRKGYVNKNIINCLWMCVCGKSYKIIYPDFYRNGYQTIPRTERIPQPDGTELEVPALDKNGRQIIDKIPLKTEVRVDLITPLEAYPAPGCIDLESMPWFIWAKYVPRKTIQAQFPKAKDLKESTGPTYTYAYDINSLNIVRTEKGDQKLILEYWEKPSNDLPEGRHCVICDDLVLLDEPFPYWNVRKDGSRVCAGFRIVEYDFDNALISHWGQSLLSPAAPIQKAINALYSWCMSNTFPTAAPILAVPKGLKLGDNSGQIENLPQVVEIPSDSPAPPQWVRMPEIPAAIIELIKRLEDKFIDVTGVHSITMGEMPSQRISGAALSYMLQIDIDKFGPTMEDYEEKERQVGYHILQTYKQFAPERVFEILAEEKGQDAQYFLEDDLDDDDLLVERASSFPESKAGQMQMLTDLQQYGAFANLDRVGRARFLQAFQTAGFNQMIEVETASITLAEEENQLLLAGKSPSVSPNHDHDIHIKIHNYLFDSIQYISMAGTDAEVKANEHIAIHLQRKIEALVPAGTPPGQPPPLPIPPEGMTQGPEGAMG